MGGNVCVCVVCRTHRAPSHWSRAAATERLYSLCWCVCRPEATALLLPASQVSVYLAPRLSSRISFIHLQFSLANSFSDDPDVKLIQSACKNELLNIRSSGSLLFKHSKFATKYFYQRRVCLSLCKVKAQSRVAGQTDSLSWDVCSVVSCPLYSETLIDLC